MPSATTNFCTPELMNQTAIHSFDMTHIACSGIQQKQEGTAVTSSM